MPAHTTADTAPRAAVLIVLSLALLVWARAAAGGFGSMLTKPSEFAVGMPQHGRFWGAAAGAVTVRSACCMCCASSAASS